MRYLRIEPQAGRKGRTFSANLLGFVTADQLWEGGRTSTDVIRPVWLCFAASEGEVRPFTANLRLGRKALLTAVAEPSAWRGRSREGRQIELLRSGEYEFLTQRHPEGVIVTAYMPEVFLLDPGMVDPAGVNFAILPSLEWRVQQDLDVAGAVRHLRKIGYLATKPEKTSYYDPPTNPTAEQAASLVPLAPLFAAYLDRRTRAPLIKDLRFHMQLLIAALRTPLASLSVDGASYSSRSKEFGQHTRLGFWEDGTEALGLLPGMAMNASHLQVEQLLAEEVSVYLSRRTEQSAPVYTKSEN